MSRRLSLSKTVRGFLKGFLYLAGAGALVGIFGLAGKAVEPVLTFTVGQQSFNFGFVVPLIGMGFGALLMFKGAREIGVSL